MLCQLPMNKDERIILFKNIYDVEGIGGIIHNLEIDSTISKFEKAKYYVDAGLLIKKYNIYDGYILARIANAIYPSEFTYRKLAWLAKSAKEFFVAGQCLDWLNVYYKENPHKNIYKDNLEKLSNEVNVHLDENVRKTSLLDIEKNDAIKSGISQSQPTKMSDLLTLDRILEVYIQSDNETVFNYISEDKSLSDKQKSRLFVQLSKYFRKIDKLEQSVYFAEKSLSFEKDLFVLRNAYWAYKHVGNANNCLKVIGMIEELGKGICGNKDISDALIALKKNFNSNFRLTDILDDLDSLNSDERKKTYKPIKGRIAYILHNALPYASGGYATRGHGLAKGLKNNGFDIKAISRPGFPYDMKPELKNKHLPEFEKIDEIDYIRIWEPYRNSVDTVDYMRQASDKFFQKFLELQPEIVIAASAYLSAVPAFIAAKKLGIPFIYEVRGFWEITTASRYPEFARSIQFKNQVQVESAIANRADYVFTLTGAMKKELGKRGTDENKITLLPNSCNPQQFTPRVKDKQLMSKLGFPENVPVIGYIGTFVFYEGLELLTEACGILKRRGLNLRLLLIGNENTANETRGPITERILQLAQEYKLSDWLVMPGRIPFEMVEAYYSLIDIAPFPRKPLPVCEMVSPMKPLEALAMEKAVLVSSVEALSEMIIPEKTGLVFEKGNVQDFANKLERLIVDKELRSMLGKNGRVWVEKERTWQKTAEKATNVIRKMLR